MAKRHLFAALAVISVAVLTSSCGHEDPTGTIRVVSTPSGAAVQLDGVDTGDVTPVEYRLAVGTHTVAVELAGHLAVPAERTVTVGPGRLVPADFQLAALGELTITSDPPGAAILIDGEDTGEVTPHTFTLVEGPRTVDVLLAGRVSDGPQSIDVSAQAPAAADFALHPAGELEVTSAPAGAAIRLDGADTGETTPHVFVLAEGDHTVMVSLAGYDAAPDSIVATVVADGSVSADFTLVELGTTGTLTVTSTPAGAAISLDGADTGEVTPHDFELAAGSHEVAVTRHGFHDVASRQVNVVAGGDAETDFALVARKIVLLEYMSGINCEGCPAMNTMLGNVEDAGYGPDKMLGIKYSGPFGGPDHHFDENEAVLQARMTVYANNTAWNWAAPTLYLDGDLTVEPNGYPGFGDLVTLLETALAADPGFAVDVSLVDPSAHDLEVVVELLPTREITHPGAVLNVAVVENPIHYDEPQNEAGEDEFHWICREFVLGDADPLPLVPGTPAVFEIDIPRQGTWTGVPDNLIAIAFVQDAATLEVLQAGVSENAHAGDH